MVEFIMERGSELTSEVLSDLIKKHRSTIPDYKKLKDMYEGNHDILSQKNKADFKPDNRLVVNFAKYIVDTLNGYFCGTPIKVSHEDKAVNEYLELVDSYNDQDDNNAELSKICSIYGHGYELIYADEEAQIGITYLDPTECFIVYDESIRRRPLFAVRYYKNTDGKLVGSFSDETSITYFEEGNKGFVFEAPEAHNFNGVPLIEYVENAEKKGAFESVATLINAFNKTISEKANDVDYFSDAYLVILGAFLEEEDLKSIKDNRIINFEGTDAEKITVNFLQKPDADQTQENLLERLQSLIFQIAMVANISDKNFGEASGVALKYKLQPMENVAMMKERKFTSGMNRRYKLIASFPGSGMKPDDWIKIKMYYTRSIPANWVEEATVAASLSGIVSKETQLSVLSVVDNAADELAKMEAESGQMGRE